MSTSNFWAEAASAVDQTMKKESKRRDNLLRTVIKNITAVQSAEPESEDQITSGETLCNTLEEILLHGLQGSMFNHFDQLPFSQKSLTPFRKWKKVWERFFYKYLGFYSTRNETNG